MSTAFSVSGGENEKKKMISDTIFQNSVLACYFSPIFHFTLFGLRKPPMQFENGMFITSVDVDVGNEKLGILNRGRLDPYISDTDSERFVGKLEQRNLPILFNLFEDFEIPVTFALRGQLFDVDTSFPKMLMNSSIKHEIGSHGYYHRAFTCLSHSEANKELKMTSITMKKFGVVPKSFVFPRNKIAHLELLKKYGYICYRGLGGFTKDATYVRTNYNELFDVHPSFFIGRIKGLSFAKKTVDVCARKKIPFHVWLHPRDIGDTEKKAKTRIQRMLSPLLEHAKRKERDGVLTFETMLSATNKVKAMLKIKGARG